MNNEMNNEWRNDYINVTNSKTTYFTMSVTWIWMNKDAVTNHIDFHTGSHNNNLNETAAMIIIHCYNGIKCIILITTGSQNDSVL